MSNSLSFSGHESFQCRNLWLKKGYDFLTDPDGLEFSDNRAGIHLGVGKNMVTSIRYWLDAFGVRDDSDKTKASELGDRLFHKENGWDPYLEDLGSLWLLHYLLVSRGQEKASIYHLVFNKFRKQRIEFTKDHLINFLINYSDEQGESHSPNTIKTDVGVFLKTYIKPNSKEANKNIEDLFSSLLIELNLVKEIENTRAENKKRWYIIESSERESLPIEIFFYSILDTNEGQNSRESISLHNLLNADNSPGNVFALHPDALVSMVEQLVQKYDGIIYKEDGGIRELQIQKSFKENEILEDYYGNR